MTRHVHICNVGTNPYPILYVTKSNICVDKVYMICSDDDKRLSDEVMKKLKESEKNIRNTLNDLDIPTERMSVDPWDYQDILDTCLDIAAKERGLYKSVDFHINVTSGTHIMGVAAASAAFFIGSDLYYVMKEDEHELDDSPMRRFQIPSLPDVSKIKGNNRKVLDLLSKDWTPNVELRKKTGFEPSKLGYSTGVLMKMGLVEKDVVGKERYLRLTYSGIVAKRMLHRI